MIKVITIYDQVQSGMGTKDIKALPLGGTNIPIGSGIMMDQFLKQIDAKIVASLYCGTGTYIDNKEEVTEKICLKLQKLNPDIVLCGPAFDYKDYAVMCAGLEFTHKYKALGLTVSAFVSSNNKDTFGPWPVYEGLPTCEIHRGLPIDLQVRHLLVTNQIDDILIGNAFAREEELKSISQIDKSRTSFKIKLSENVTDEERNIVFNYHHFGRGDASDYLVRSSVPRNYYRKRRLPFRKYDGKFFKRGDVVIVNDNLSHYRGELQIIEKEIINSGERNYIGRLESEELMLLDLLKPEHLFKFIEF